ncbi:MAG: DNA repair protein RecN [Candidatus Firestonebacteria bacterium]|nr:DNA repair protein RecN [Candidatus Firestonebacteria bacterium]
MLERLYIKNFALIDNMEIEFMKGFIVLTGETGAGKTMIVEALNFVCGERARQEIIRTGCDTAVIEAEFSVTNHEKIFEVLSQLNIHHDEGMLIIRREINTSGKSKCLVNGYQITLSMLKQIGDLLVDIHGQHEHQSLFSPDNHLILLDNFAEINSDVKAVKKIYREYKDLEEKIQRFEEQKRERLSKIDFWEFQIKEIDDMNLVHGEDDILTQKASILRNAEKLIKSVEYIYSLLYEGGETPSVLEQIDKIRLVLKEISVLDPSLKKHQDVCENVFLELKETTSDLSRYRNSLEFNSEEQIKIEERIIAIQQLKKKYGNSIKEILSYRENIQKELEEIKIEEDNFSGYIEKLKITKNELEKRVLILSEKRSKAAMALKTKIEIELSDLGMSKTKFVINNFKEENPSGEIRKNGKNYHLFPWGIDKIEFYISPNPGEEAKPLSKIASGGEISRIMLALKTAETEGDCIPTVIFDEIDMGVGGAIASKIGKKLKSISMNHQVICITHLPQIASIAGSHFFISKLIKDERTITEVQLLDSKTRAGEIARMLGGEKITELTLKHARELLKG